MKRLLLLLTVAALSGFSFAQTSHTFAAIDNPQTFTAKQFFSAGLGITPVTVSSLPASPSAGQLAIVTDGVTSSDCTVGSGSNTSLCEYSGSAWQSIGGGGGGGSISGLTVNALVTGKSATSVQTPSTTATMDTSGNISSPGKISSGAGGSVAGMISVGQGTAPSIPTNAVGIMAPTAVTGYEIVLASAAASGIPHYSNSSNVITETISALSSADLPVTNTRRTCAVVVGSDDAAAVLANSNLGPQGRLCFVPAAATIVEIDVSADGGTPNVVVGRNRAGTVVNLVSAALTTAASGGIACSSTAGGTGIDGATSCSATLQNTGLNAGDYLQLVSGTAGGTAKRMSIFVTWTVN